MLVTQFAATILAPLVFAAHSMEAAGSALLGGLVASSGLAWQALRFFRPYRAAQPGALLAGMLMSEVFKLLFFAAAFALIFKTQKWLLHLPFLLAFIVVYLAPLMARPSGRLGASKHERAE
ncbi:ATP synthase subunit I [Magnetovirga frankeli]|nr:ATP synthase subunit I [gamma proteobacterium SS-5]